MWSEALAVTSLAWGCCDGRGLANCACGLGLDSGVGSGQAGVAPLAHSQVQQECEGRALREGPRAGQGEESELGWPSTHTGVMLGPVHARHRNSM